MLQTIAERIRAEKSKVIVIDGMAASGKSTAAMLLSNELNASVIHMDDFFLPAELRNPKRFEQAGGNVHYERFFDEVVTKLKGDSPILYRPFDCHSMDYKAEIKQPCGEIVIIEGCYAMHPYFGKYWDLALFFKVDPAVQNSRILQRNGEAMLAMFQRRWIPLEQNYFDKCHTEEKADVVINGELLDLR